MLKICRLLFPVKYCKFFSFKNQNISRTLPYEIAAEFETVAEMLMCVIETILVFESVEANYFEYSNYANFD